MAEMNRDKAADGIKEMNGMLELSEARREKLGEEIEGLTKEMAELATSSNKTKELRATEKKENEKSIKEAEEGKKTVEKAIQVLERYYKTAAKNAKMFLQESAVDDAAPEAGFDDDYAGSQDGSVGVLGMLDVVKSDFARTIKETAQNEEEAVKTFNELDTNNGISQAAKSEALKANTKAKSESDAEDAKNRASLTSNSKLLDTALKGLAALDKACKKGGSSAAEKKIARDEEMDALKKAICILDAHGTGGAANC